MGKKEKNSLNVNLNKLLTKLPFLDSKEADLINFEGKKIFLRADFNTPLDEHNNFIDDGRLIKTLPTINYLLDRGASIIVAGHLRNPGGQTQEKWSLKPLARRLSRIWGINIKFASDLMNNDCFEMAKNLKQGEIMLLENLRFYNGENTNDDNFSKHLASLADFYVNDAFGTCHSNYASMININKYVTQSFAGLQLKNELTVLKRALDDPIRPLVAIIGGIKAEEKISAIEIFLNIADYVLLAGTSGDVFSSVLYNTNSYNLNKITEENKVKIKEILKRFFKKDFNAKLFLPIDAIASNINDDTDTITTTMQDLSSNYKVSDIGPATMLLFEEVLKNAKTIIWNGPLGTFEKAQFSHGTAFLAKILTKLNAITLAGGVKTSTALLNMGETAKLSFLSTGGEAFLKILSNQPLIALDALTNKKN